MNFHLLHHRKLSEVLSIPDGLQDLMADITREVLRYQPSNIESFIADYLESMVATRELMYVANNTIDDILAKSIRVDQLMRIADISSSQAIAITRIIEDEFRKRNLDEIREFDIMKKLIDECKISVEQARKISNIIDESWCHFYNQNLRRSNVNVKVNPEIFKSITQNTLNYHMNKKSSEINNSSELNSNKSLSEKENAAIIIQKWYRNQTEINQINAAASKIQASLKGLQMRKEFKKRQSAAVTIQTKFRDYKERQKSKKFDDTLDEN